MEKIQESNSLLCKFSSATKTSFLVKNTKKTTTLQQVTGGNTPNLVLKRMLEPFLTKKRLWNLCKKKFSKQKLNQWLKTYKQAKGAKLRSNIRHN